MRAASLSLAAHRVISLPCGILSLSDPFGDGLRCGVELARGGGFA
jgi:hypothetical protein